MGKMKDLYTDVEEAGIQARREGKNEHDNPYRDWKTPDDAALYGAWKKGFNSDADRAAFTPGPWSIGFRSEKKNIAFVNAGAYTICKCDGGDDPKHKPANALANARLIAAAPDMYAALQEVEAYLDDRADAEYTTDSASPRGNEAMRLLVEVREALAKANGSAS